MKKVNKILLGAISSFFSLSSIVGTIVLFNNKINENVYENNYATNTGSSTKINDEVSTKPLVPLDYNVSVPLLVQDTGPIISQKSIITSLDWFGAERWHLDLESAKLGDVTFLPTGVTRENWNEYFDSAMINFSLDRNNNHLWVLSNSGNGNSNVPKQKIMQIDSETGKILMIKEINYSGSRTRLYRKIQVLDSGNVIIYSHGEPNFDLYTKSDGQIKTVKYDENKLTSNMTSDINSMNKEATRTFSFLFSISPGLNIAVFTPEAWYPNKSGVQNSGKIYFAYVDDNLNLLSSSSEWNTAKYMNNNRDEMTEDTFEIVKSDGTTSSKKYVDYNGNSFPKLTYKLPDGRTLVTIYNKLYIFWPSSDKLKPTFKEFNLNVQDEKGKFRPIESWTTDTSNNVYVKFAGDTKIQKIEINGSTYDSTDIKVSSYYDLSGSPIDEIKNNAKNLVMYNVYGYSGQIMLLNPIRVESSNIPDLKDESISQKFSTKDFGLAIAVVDSKTSTGQGDTKGLLNTDKAFTKSSTFNISENILKNKLPSEISRNDLEITENGFLTQNNTIDSVSGSLKYKQFEKVEINDKSKYLKITVNIDQIPWFVNNGVMPSNIPPLTITKEFSTSNDIETRVTWKDENLDYDFKNTLPSKVTENDIKRFDPFDINLTSQNISISGVNYPMKDYFVENANDQTGTITIKTIYKYLPIDVEAKESNVISQEFSKEYHIFKLSDTKSFNFIGNGNSQTEENIKDIPQLKELSESNFLPSSFNTNDISSILKFINTDTSAGYPISKMNFVVTPNDINGTLTISGKLQDGYYDDQQYAKEFKKTYIGLNKISDYNFSLNNIPIDFDKSEYLPSEINEQIIYKYFAVYRGFNSSDIFLEIIPNNEKGELRLIVKINSNYPNSVVENNGFVLENEFYTKEFVINGFKTSLEYEEQYIVTFKDDNNSDLENIKKFSPNQIKQILDGTNNGNELYIGNKKITNKKDFVINLIEKQGSKIPNVDQIGDDFAFDIYYNDTNGEITVKLIYKNISGLSNELVYIQRYTGFAKGNQIVTNDNLSFKTESKLFFDNPNFKNELPSSIKNNLENMDIRQKEIKKFLGFFSGAYLDAIEKNNFSLNIAADDIFGYLTVKITFSRENVTDPQSLLSYTATYKGFLTE